MGLLRIPFTHHLPRQVSNLPSSRVSLIVVLTHVATPENLTCWTPLESTSAADGSSSTRATTPISDHPTFAEIGSPSTPKFIGISSPMPSSPVEPSRTGGFQANQAVSNEQGNKEREQIQPLAAGDLPFTDSGCASAPNADIALGTQTGLKPAGKSIENDARTVYSSATTIMPSFTRQCISDICRDLHVKVEHVREMKEESLFKTVTGLIKAFAIKLGMGTSNELNRRIMYFVHKL